MRFLGALLRRRTFFHGADLLAAAKSHAKEKGWREGMLILDYFERNVAIIKNGEDSIFMDCQMLPKGVREGDVLRIRPAGQEQKETKSVELLVVPEGKKVRLCRMEDTVECSKKLFQTDQPQVMYLEVDTEESIRRREAIREFALEYDRKKE